MICWTPSFSPTVISSSLLIYSSIFSFVDFIRLQHTICVLVCIGKIFRDKKECFGWSLIQPSHSIQGEGYQKRAILFTHSTSSLLLIFCFSFESLTCLSVSRLLWRGREILFERTVDSKSKIRNVCVYTLSQYTTVVSSNTSLISIFSLAYHYLRGKWTWKCIIQRLRFHLLIHSQQTFCWF